MSNRGNCIISILILAVGIVFTYYFNHDSFTKCLVTICGLSFVVPAAISLLSLFYTRKGANQGAILHIVQLICGVGGLGLGLSIIFLPEVFRSLLFYPFGALLVIGGLFQEFQISHKYKLVDYPGWLHVVPILLLVAGVVLLCVPALHTLEAERWMVLIVGISSVLFGINGLIISWMAHKLPKLVAATEKSEQATKKSEKAAEDSEKAAQRAEKVAEEVKAGEQGEKHE